MKQRTRQSYSPEFKAEAVTLARSGRIKETPNHNPQVSVLEAEVMHS